MKLKMDEQGHAVLQDGKPVYVHDDGKEVAIDVVSTVNTITRLTEESKGFKTRAQTAEAKLKDFEGIEDAAAAIKAMETVKNLDDGKLVQAGKVEEIKAAAKKAAEEQVAAANKANADKLSESEKALSDLRNQLNTHMIGGSFKGSKLIADKFAIPADFVEARFGHHFKIEDGKVVASDANGNKVYSRAKPGEVAEFEEALDILVESYPHKDQILKGSGNKGDGARPSNGNGNGGGNQPAPGAMAGTRAERVAAIAKKFPDLPVR